MINSDTSHQLFERSKKVTPGGVHSPVRAFHGVGGTPRFIVRAEGLELEDADHQYYTDYCMSWGALIFEHQNPEISQAVQAALQRGWAYGTAEPYSLQLAELITSTIPWVQKIRFVNSGTEAVMTALRIARAATGRTQILKFAGCYHGHVDSLLVQAGSGLAEMSSPNSAGVTPAVAADTWVLPLNDLEKVEELFKLHGNSIAAIIVEGIPANHGLLLQKSDYLKQLTEIAHAHGSLMILDEVITGFRVAWGGMAEQMGLRPDLVTYGKLIGAGFPVGAVGGRQDLMDQLAPCGPVYQAGTLSGNPIAMVAGQTNLTMLKNLKPYTSMEQKNHQMAMEIAALGRKKGVPIQVQHHASLFWMILGQITTSDGVVRAPHEIPKEHAELHRHVFHKLLEEGIYLAPSPFEVSFLSVAHSEMHQTKLLTALEKGLSTLPASLLPR